MTIEITKTEFLANWPNGRPFKHGAMKISMDFHLYTQHELCTGIEQFMQQRAGQTRGIDYNIPAWNFAGIHHHPRKEEWTHQVTITFVNDETFVMAKMQWDYG